MSNAQVEPLKDHESAEFWFIWLFANMGSLLVGHWLSRQFIEILWPSAPVPPNTYILRLITNPIPRVLLVGLITGTLLGVLQWLVFRLWGFRVNWKWVALSIFVCVAFPTLREVTHADFLYVLGGVFLGLAQWRILQPIVSRAGWWIPATAVAGAALLQSITPNPYYDEPVTLFTGIILGGITGVVLVLLLKPPIHQPEVSFQRERG